MTTSFRISFVSAAMGALLAFGAFAAHAGEITQYDMSLMSVAERAAVIAELKRAQAAGELGLGRTFGEGSEHRPPVAFSMKTRAEVVAELQRAQAAGELGLGRTFGEGSDERPQVAARAAAPMVVAR